ncbi:hypothetical protein PMNALOAF_2366 [Methylobacterium adhaesivum]|nr:hypothetical protein PMNALOAF_2366 [Methylobacterium adhaesivum]
MGDLKFGTNGLRGLVTNLVGGATDAYASAFFRSVAATAGPERSVVIGRNLRDSSPGVAATLPTRRRRASGSSIAVRSRPRRLHSERCGAAPAPSWSRAATFPKIATA